MHRETCYIVFVVCFYMRQALMLKHHDEYGPAQFPAAIDSWFYLRRCIFLSPGSCDLLCIFRPIAVFDDLGLRLLKSGYPRTQVLSLRSISCVRTSLLILDMLGLFSRLSLVCFPVRRLLYHTEILLRPMSTLKVTNIRPLSPILTLSLQELEELELFTSLPTGSVNFNR